MKNRLASVSLAGGILAAGLVLVLANGQPKFYAQRNHPRPAPVPVHNGQTQFGDPLPGLTAAQLQDFAAGLAQFQEVETVASGLGPIYNNVSCVACHFSVAPGGASALTVTRFGRVVNGVFDPLAALGGSLLQEFAIDPACQEVIPPQANVIAHRQTTPLFGLGLIEAIPDDVLLQIAGLRNKPDGVMGRAAIIEDIVSGQERVGRLGWKAQQATLLAFAGDAYLNEMGITSRLFPVENAPNGNTNLLALFDHVADPEDTVNPATGKTDIEAFADFMRYLGAPPQLPLSPSARSGQMLFQQVGCATCHIPMLPTGSSAIAALDRKLVPLYSDLLLHDMGSLGDGIAQADAGQREMRTAPLWGLRASAPYLHDGRAANLNDAISAHDGEARVVRARYLQLNLGQRQQLLDFLNSI